MDSLFKGSKEPEHTTDVSDYVMDARDRLRRLANRTASPITPAATSIASTPIEHLQATIATPMDIAPLPALTETRPAPPAAAPTGIDNLRNAVVDRAVDQLVQRVLNRWEQGAQPQGRLDQHIVDRLVERLVAKIETGS